MTISYGDVPLIDPVTGRFPDSFAPPSVGADAAAAAQSAADALADRQAAAASATAAASSAATASAAQAATEAVDITVGTITTGAPDEPAAAEIVGTAPAFTLNLTIPRGGGLSVLDNGDGTLTLAGTAITDNLDGTLTIGA